MPSDPSSPWKSAAFWNDAFESLHTPWDLGHPYEGLVQLERRAELIPGARVLVPGCGSGHDALYFCEMGYQVSVVDWSHAAIADLRVQARRRHFEMEALVSDYREIPATWNGSFDVWVEHTFFCALDPEDRSVYPEVVARLLRPGGRLLGAFFISDRGSNGSVNPKKEGPPFWISEESFQELFMPWFEVVTFEKSEASHPALGVRAMLADLKLKSI